MCVQFRQVEYEGIRKYHDPLSGIEETLVDPRKNQFVAKEMLNLYVSDLMPRTVYTFNISAKFIDASWGPVSTVRVETTAEGVSFVCYY